jgi:hypothetical protein
MSTVDPSVSSYSLRALCSSLGQTRLLIYTETELGRLTNTSLFIEDENDPNIRWRIAKPDKLAYAP